MTYLFCSNSHNALPSSLTKKFNCLYIFKFSIFAVHKKEKCSILRGSKIFPITVQIVLQYLHNVSMRVKYFPFLLQILIILGSAWIWEENDMARFYQYSSSLKWSQQMTFPMDQVCGENPDNHSFLAITMIYILWRNLDQYYGTCSRTILKLIAINFYFIDKWSLCNENIVLVKLSIACLHVATADGIACMELSYI